MAENAANRPVRDVERGVKAPKQRLHLCEGCARVWVPEPLTICIRCSMADGAAA